MRIPDDLSPADVQLRAHLVDTLRESREGRDISLHQLGRHLGISASAVYALEHRLTWQAKTIMRYARGIGFRIKWEPFDLEPPDDDDVMSVILAAGDTSTPAHADAVHWRTVCYDLVRIRRATHTAVAFAERLGIHENAVHHWEANPDGSTVTAAQRHARALGGALPWRLTPVASPLIGKAPTQRRAA